MSHVNRLVARLNFGLITLSLGVLLACAVTLFSTPAASAADLQAQASQLSDHAFTLLNSINAEPGKAGPMLAPVASLAGDAQSLSNALSANDHEAAIRAIAAILADRNQIDDAAAKSASHIDREQWNTMRGQIAALAKAIPPARGAASGSARPEVSSTGSSIASAAPPSSEKLPPAPKIMIASRVFKGATVRLRGFLEGTDLKSAAIYDGDQKTKDINVSDTPGEQRINFDFTIEQPSTAASIRVVDVYGREAQAMVAPDRLVAGAMKGSEELIEVEPGGGSGATGSGLASSGAAAADGRLASSGPMPRNNTAEIPRSADALSPSRRHLNSHPSLAPLTGVQINIIDAEELMSAPGNVQVVGQIAGAGVRRAGVYLNGRLAKSFALSPTGYSAFNVTFPMPAGSTATIRAYGNGSDFVEASIDTTGTGAGGMTVYRNPPMYPAYPVSPYPASPYYRPNPYAYGAAPYAYGTNPYANPNPYTNPYGYPPQPYYGAPPYGYPPGQPAPKRPWWTKVFP